MEYGITLIVHDVHDYDRVVSQLANDPVFDSILAYFKLSCNEMIERTPSHQLPKLIGMFIQQLAGVIQRETKKSHH